MAASSSSPSSPQSLVIGISHFDPRRPPAKTSYLVNIPLGANIFLPSSNERSPYQRIKAVIERNPFFAPSTDGEHDVHVVIGVNQPEAKTPEDLAKWVELLSPDQLANLRIEFPEAGKPDPYQKKEIDAQLDLLTLEKTELDDTLRGLAEGKRELLAYIERASDFDMQERREQQESLGQVVSEIKALSGKQRPLAARIRELNSSRVQAKKSIADMESGIRRSMPRFIAENLTELRSKLTDEFPELLTSDDPRTDASTSESSTVDVATSSRATHVYVEQYFWNKHQGEINYPAIRNNLLHLGRNERIVEQLAQSAGTSKDIIYITLDPDTALERSQLSRMEAELGGEVPTSSLVVGHYTLELPSTVLLKAGDQLDWSHFLVAKNAVYDKRLKEGLSQKVDSLVLAKYSDKGFEDIAALPADQRLDFVASNCAALKTKLLDAKLTDSLRASIETLLALYESSTWEPLDLGIKDSFNAILESFHLERERPMPGSRLMTPFEECLSTISQQISWDLVLYPPEPALAFLLFKKSEAVSPEAPLDFFATIKGEKLWGEDGAASEGQQLAKNIDTIWKRMAAERGIASPPRSVSFVLDYKTEIPPRFLDHGDDRLPKQIDDLVTMMDTGKGRADIREALVKIHGDINQSSIHTQFLTKRLAFLEKRFNGVEVGGKPLLEAARESFENAYKHEYSVQFHALMEECLVEIAKLVREHRTQTS